MEALSFLLKRAEIEGFLFGCRVGAKGGVGVQISHMLFVDDTLIFCEASQDWMTYLSWLLM